ncbi:MAG: DEAD/DEAH box helicase, partial [Planctomycetales bacterium]|nr:DEAD/DEAH box helicase [Planctomycetales bacterium]
MDDDLEDLFLREARAWLAKNKFEVRLEMSEEDGFHIVSGSGGDWCPRVYVEMITELFQRGVTRCLVGTRGLLGEGWDASKINVLIDLTTVTTSMTVNQLRGRSIRLDAAEPAKL